MVKKRVDVLVLNSNETITLDSPEIENGLGIVDNGGVAIDKGKIVLAASTDLLERKFRAGRTINAEDEIVGSYGDSSGVTHGFLGTQCPPRPPPGHPNIFMPTVQCSNLRAQQPIIENKPPPVSADGTKPLPK